MRVRLLNLKEAFQLASVLSKYVDINKLNPNEDAIEFVAKIVEKITPGEYLFCSMLMTDKTEEDVVTEEPLDILSVFIEGLKANQVVSLISFYKSFGF